MKQAPRPWPGEGQGPVPAKLLPSPQVDPAIGTGPWMGGQHFFAHPFPQS